VWPWLDDAPILGSAPLLLDETAIAHLIHLIKHRQSPHHLGIRQLSKCAEVEMSITSMPQPACICAPRRETHQLSNVGLQVVQPRRFSLDLREQLVVLIKDPQHAMVDVNATPYLIELAETNDARPQPQNEVYSGEGTVTSILVGEDEGALAFNLGDGTVTELDRAPDLEIDLGKDVPRTSHMVGCAGVEDPSRMVAFLRRTKISKYLLFLNVDDATWRSRRGESTTVHCARWRGSKVDDGWVALGQKEALLLLFALGPMGLGRFISLLLVTLPGLVPFLATVTAQVTAARLSLALYRHIATLVLITAAIPASKTSPRAGSEPVLGLHVGHPLLHEEQTTAPFLGGGWLPSLLDGAEVADGFFRCQPVEIKQRLHGDRYLLKLVKHGV
jgi:hypothetical protein